MRLNDKSHEDGMGGKSLFFNDLEGGGGIAWGRGSSGWGEDWGSSSKLMRRGEQDQEGIIPVALVVDRLLLMALILTRLSLLRIKSNQALD